MTVTLVAPTEPPQIKTLGMVDASPERYGVDILFTCPAGLAGVQRKEFNDLHASMRDGRLAKEVQQMQHLPIRCLTVEGKPRFTADGDYIHQFVRWTRKSYERLVFSLLSRGIWVLYSTDVYDTVRLVEQLRDWCSKDEHLSLDYHPQAASHWLDNGKAWGSRVLQSVDGIGPKHADAIIEHFGGLPIVMTCTEEELVQVKGIGKRKAQDLMRAFGRGQKT